MVVYGMPSYLDHQLVRAMSVGDKVRLNRWTEPKPLPFLVHFLWQGLGDGAHLGAGHQFRVRPSWEAERAALPSVELEYSDPSGYNVIPDGLLQWCSSIPLEIFS